ncbi:hypothetical protein BPAE_0040g00610 [Botrytis paeoniae]|uniref:Uncharacterized protein n=1 Tax=Botrytis paeoniae TaxID=278948 RepID=A0A4Z1FWA6_9HELO|nr:hypothetical protein BPAE_0040g00610 [Botrytis paeoniae]
MATIAHVITSSVEIIVHSGMVRNIRAASLRVFFNSLLFSYILKDTSLSYTAVLEVRSFRFSPVLKRQTAKILSPDYDTDLCSRQLIDSSMGWAEKALRIVQTKRDMPIVRRYMMIQIQILHNLLSHVAVRHSVRVFGKSDLPNGPIYSDKAFSRENANGPFLVS